MLDRYAFTVIVPVYNNAATLEQLVDRISNTLQAISPDFEIIFVNDASRDNSKDIIQRLKAKNAKFSSIDLKENTGQWEATLLGIAKAHGKYIVTIDADLQYDPEDIPKLYAHLLENNLALVYGIPARMLEGIGGLRNRIQNVILRKSITSSFKILQRNVVFDASNRFICKRHFECHERFEVAPAKKGIVKVNEHKKLHGGFRRHMLRNANIMLTYLPEYDLRYRHPLVFAGTLVFALSAIVALGLFLASKISLHDIVFFSPLLIVGVLLIAAGVRWRWRYKRVRDRRKKLLAA